MDSVTIRRNVFLRAIVTERLRADLQEELQNAADEIDQRIAEIDAQTRHYVTDLQRTDLQQAMALRRRIEAEKRNHQEQRDALLERKAQVAELQDGAEVLRGTLESYVEIKVGDNIAEVLGGVEIVTKDNEVVEIRQRQMIEEEDEAPATPIITPGADR
jgi:hypothetical protein